tara:strand:- start:3975 stop:4136 length:162 start_codon:yes stop_codon:yes gene_type:complete
MESKMLREIANDKLTPKKRDIESSSDFFERLVDPFDLETPNEVESYEVIAEYK